LGIAIFCGIIPAFGACIDFLTILLTNTNIYYYLGMTMEIYNVNLIFFAGIWFPLNGIFAVYLGAEILRLKKKWYLMSIYILLGVIYEIVIFLDPQGFFINVFPPNPGEDLIGGYFRLVLSPFF